MKEFWDDYKMALKYYSYWKGDDYKFTRKLSSDQQHRHTKKTEPKKHISNLLYLHTMRGWFRGCYVSLLLNFNLLHSYIYTDIYI